MNVLTSWTTRIPSGWKVEPLKRLAAIRNSNVDKKTYDGGYPVRLCNYTDVYYNERITADLQLMEATATAQERARFTLRAGDVIITKDSEAWDDIGVPAYVPDDLPGIVCGYHLTLLRPFEGIVDGRFLMRCLLATGIREQLWVSANGITRFGLTQRGIKEAMLPVPPLDSQRAIADFLDQKAASIDMLIAKKERLMELLREKRQALITQAVTKGLDPSVPMKDSGIEWLGEIPAHWDILPLRRLVRRIEQGWSPVAEDRNAEEGEWGVLKLSAVTGGIWRWQEHKAIPSPTNQAVRDLKVEKGDLLVTRANTVELVADAVVVSKEPPSPIILSDLIYRLRTNHLAKSEWVRFMLRSSIGRFQVAGSARGSSMTMAKVSHSHIREWLCPTPPPNEQLEIIERLSISLSKLRKTENLISGCIERLREYRQAVITAAVTGQLEVAENLAAEAEAVA